MKQRDIPFLVAMLFVGATVTGELISWHNLNLARADPPGAPSLPDSVVNDAGERGFHVIFPGSWTFDDYSYHGDLRAESSLVLGAKSKAHIEIEVNESGLTKEWREKDWVDQELVFIPRRHDINFKLVEVADVHTSPGARKVTFLADSPYTKVRVRTTIYYFFATSMVYKITAYALENDYAKYSDEIDNIVGSFRDATPGKEP